MDNPSGEPIEVSIDDLKAVFMVGDFLGRPSYRERKKYVAGERPSGKKVEVTFIDGEVLMGSTLGCDRPQIESTFTSPNPVSFKILSVECTISFLRSFCD